MTDRDRIAEPIDLDDISGNPSENKTFHEIVEARFSRRAVLRGFGAGVAAAAAGPAFGILGASPASAAGKGLTFTEIKHTLDDKHHVAPGYSVQVAVRWGDPLFKDAPAFDQNKVVSAAQNKQFGYNCDFLAYMPLPLGSRNSTHGLLFSNHEFNNAELMWTGIASNSAKHDILSHDQVLTEIAATGASVVEIKREGKDWKAVQDSRYNRRVTAATPMRVAGPAAGHARMKTKADPAGALVLGTMNNCAGGVTPWGTCLTGEENINNYFAADPKHPTEAASYKRMTIPEKPRQPWYKFEERFDLKKEPHEANRFGWVVEIDPYDPRSMPVKRTSLGRMKHEGATCAVDKSGRVAVYTGDDQVYEYVYKFVTNGKFDPKNRAANKDLLDDGTLYVAKFNADGTVNWLPLVFGQGKLVPANGFNSQADVLIDARRAADALGATKMDRPEDIEPDPLTGRVYVVLTKLPARKAQETDAANPRAENKFGHIIELIPPGSEGPKGRMANSDHAAATFRWEMFLLAGNPAEPGHGAKYGPGVKEGYLAAPDNVAFDRRGHLWIVTDGQDDAIGAADSVYACDLNGPRRAATKLFFNAPRGAEVCGPCFTPDAKTLFLAIQHPGEEKGSTFAKPSTRWPDFKADMPPRPSVVAVTKDDGGEIGT
ncbi:MAG: PhoX family protein [Rhodospirillales bacterium]